MECIFSDVSRLRINIESVNVANYYSYESSLVIVVSCTHTWQCEREEDEYIVSQHANICPVASRPGMDGNPFFRETLNGRSGLEPRREFLTLRELLWQQWQVVINPRRERLKNGGTWWEREEEEETDGPTDSPSLSLAASDPLIFCLYLFFSLVTLHLPRCPDPFARRFERKEKERGRERDAASRGTRRGFRHYILPPSFLSISLSLVSFFEWCRFDVSTPQISSRSLLLSVISSKFSVVHYWTWILNFPKDDNFRFLSLFLLSLSLSLRKYQYFSISRHCDTSGKKEKEGKKIRRRPSQRKTRTEDDALADDEERKREWEGVSPQIFMTRVHRGRTTHICVPIPAVVVVAIAVCTHTNTLQDTASKFLCLFFVVYRAVSGIDASVSSPRAEKRSLSLLSSSLSRELCFRNVRATRTNALVHIYTYMCRTMIADICMCVVQTDVCSRACRRRARLAGKREESKVEGSAPRYSSTFGSACQKALFTVSQENELFNSSRCRW